MSSTELEHLIKMINQIADNIAIVESDDVATAKLADHLNCFWARSMKEQIFNYANSDGEKLQPVAKKALTLLQSE